jgi:acyl-CoA reductase-like NAD-dependent aldehyde dehydrogenase
LLELVPKYFDPRAVTAVPGRRAQVSELLKLPLDFIFFTGSTKVGKIVARAAAENLTPVLLELGGQNPAMVDETANIADAAKKIVWGAMAWGGQWCTSPGYWIAADIVRIKDGVLAEHWDVLQDEATRESSKSGLPMFGDQFSE